MASSLTEKTPITFIGEAEYYKNQRAFTPLDQITTGISDEETVRYNLSGKQMSYSFNQSTDPFQAFQLRHHYSSEDSGSVHSAHAANIPAFSMAFRPGQDNP
jgi:hypothetical protein